jgi:hypothetical protein
VRRGEAMLVPGRFSGVDVAINQVRSLLRKRAEIKLIEAGLDRGRYLDRYPNLGSAKFDQFVNPRIDGDWHLRRNADLAAAVIALFEDAKSSSAESWKTVCADTCDLWFGMQGGTL